jgi:PKD repeat protein
MVKQLLRVLAIMATSAGAACVHQSDTQVPAGPSVFAHSVTMTAIPDRITQDGASQSSIQVQVNGPDGRPLSGIVLRMDTATVQNGQLQFFDVGTLASRTIVTGNDGIARTVYTAPPPDPASIAQMHTVSIRAVPIDANAQTEVDTFVDIRLVPPGVVLPPAGTPTAQFTVTPQPVNVNVPAIFDGSLSSPGQNALQITSYAWNFGDGATGSGQSVTHTFTAQGTYNVTLTVTNDRGLRNTSAQAITAGLTQAPSPAFVFSPTAPVVGQAVVFNADTSKPAPGRTLTEFNWIFGDGDTTQPTSGFVVSHTFAAAGTYNVTLSVLDDVGQKATVSVSVPVSTANPIAKLTLTKTGGLSITADGSLSTAVGSTQITNYTFKWGDSTPNTSGTAAVVPHTFPLAGTYVVTLVVTDNFSPPRTGTITASITVP